MVKNGRIQLRILLARCLFFALAWCVGTAPAGLAWLGQGACEAECPCEAERAFEARPAEEPRSAEARDHHTDCPADCVSCSCTQGAADLPHPQPALALDLSCREVMDSARPETQPFGVVGEVFRPPRSAA